MKNKISNLEDSPEVTTEVTSAIGGQFEDRPSWNSSTHHIIPKKIYNIEDSQKIPAKRSSAIWGGGGGGGNLRLVYHKPALPEEPKIDEQNNVGGLLVGT
jgi:hypothetical protein